MNAPQTLTWTDANQQLLAGEFARLKQRLRGEDPAPTAAPLAAARAVLGGSAAIDTLTAIFGLSGFERDILLLAAGVELDTEIAALCGAARGRPDRPWATFGLALALLPDPHWSALAPVRPLRHWRLVEIDEGQGLVEARLRVDERILHYLAGVDYLDPRLRPLLRLVPPPAEMAANQAQLAAAIAPLLAADDRQRPVVVLSGDDPHGQEDVAARAAAKLEARLHALAATELPADPRELAALAVLWRRESSLSRSILLIDRADAGAPESLDRFLALAGGPVLLAAREPPRLGSAALRYVVDKPDAPAQRALWRSRLGAAAASLDGALDAIAGQYRLSARTIAAAASQYAPRAAGDGADGAALWRACRQASVVFLGGLAQRIEPAAGWDDLILPAAQTAVLRQIAAHVRHRLRVYHDWGFAAKNRRGLGVGALFCGESGTGKTMAAEVLARELDLELYRIDLSAVVSKYIGETEKNLRRVFDAAEESGAILLFDEADALFGKRSEVKDSHDRYANIEVSYLLQRMEAYRGLAILTTNLKNALDQAFQRRLRFILQFPFPDTAQREAIWRGSFPATAPLDGIDCARLAQLNVAGGGIRNIALGAAFFAAAAGEPLNMAHLLRSARTEAAKREGAVHDAEIRGWS